MSKGINSTPLITHERLANYVTYDPDTGEFTWKVCTGGKPIGFKAGATLNTGYVQLQIDKRFYTAHRLAWLYWYGEFPPKGIQVDHINGIRNDNRIINLRLSSQSNQNRNTDRRRCKNKHGLIGVSQYPSGRWNASTTIKGTKNNLGMFETKEEAAEAYDNKVLEIFPGCPDVALNRGLSRKGELRPTYFHTRNLQKRREGLEAATVK
jgi:hypothetical protein